MSESTSEGKKVTKTKEVVEAKPLNLHQKLLEVKKTVEFLKKEAKNEGQRFNYVSSSQTLLSVREKMNEMGLLLIPSVTNREAKVIGQTEKGGNVIFTELDLTYTWLNVDKPEETLEVKWYGQGLDTGGEKGGG